LHSKKFTGMHTESVENQSQLSAYGKVIFEGMKLAVENVYEQARRDNTNVVIMRDGQVVWVNAREINPS
jgi:hypothetical protein